jgi:hypothetical protein
MKIWERGGTTPHIINPVFLHNMPFDNTLATILSMITFLLHNISLAIKCNTWIFHSLRILVSLYLWAMTWPNLPTRPGTKWDFGTTGMCVVSLTLHECVWSASHYTCFTLGKMPWLPTEQEAGWASGKSLDPARYLNDSFIDSGHSLPATLNALSQLPFYSQSYLEYMLQL